MNLMFSILFLSAIIGSSRGAPLIPATISQPQNIDTQKVADLGLNPQRTAYHYQPARTQRLRPIINSALQKDGFYRYNQRTRPIVNRQVRRTLSRVPIQRQRRRMNDDPEEQPAILSYDSFLVNASNSTNHNEIVLSNEEQIKNALASAGDRPTIVIVNQTPTEPIIIPAIDPSSQTPCNSSENGIVTPYDPNIGMLQPDPNNTSITTFSQIDALITTVGHVGQIVDEIYAYLPDSDASSSLSSAGEDKSALDQAANFLKFYAKVRGFIAEVVTRRQELIDNILYVKNNVQQFKVNQQDMLKFYGLDEKYYNARMTCKVYETKDAKFQSYWVQIAGYTDDYESSINIIINEVRYFEQVVYSLLDQVTALGDNKFDNAALNAIQKFDSVIMILASLIEIKEKIEESINSLQSSLINLKDYRVTISTTIDNANQLATYYKLGEPKSTTGSFTDLSKVHMIIILGFLTMII